MTQNNHVRTTRSPHRSHLTANQRTDAVYGNIHLITQPTRRKYHPIPGQRLTASKPIGPPTTAIVAKIPCQNGILEIRKQKKKQGTKAYRRPSTSPLPSHTTSSKPRPQHCLPRTPETQRSPYLRPTRQTARRRGRGKRASSPPAHIPAAGRVRRARHTTRRNRARRTTSGRRRARW